jgi:hypothetical protein
MARGQVQASVPLILVKAPAVQPRPADRWTAILLAGMVGALAIKVFLAWTTLGTNDVLVWQFAAKKALHTDAVRLYTDGVDLFYGGRPYPQSVFNHPPFMIYLLRFLAWISNSAGIPFAIFFRILTSVADSLSFLLTWTLLQNNLSTRGVSWGEAPGARLGLLLLSVSPVNIMVAGFHANSDPLMILFLLSAVWCLEVRESPLLAGCCVGMALNIKIVPLLLLPALLFYLKGWRARASCLTSAAVTALIPALPCLAAAPRAVAANVLAYNSFPGVWGLGAIWRHLPGFDAFSHYGKFALAAGMVLMAYLINRFDPKPRIFEQWGASLLLFLVVTPGFGIQYLYWVTPWIVALGSRAAVLLYLTSGAFMFAVYTYWSGGFPWWFADSQYKPWVHWYHVPHLLAWGSIGVLLVWFWRLQSRRRAPAISNSNLLSFPDGADGQISEIAGNTKA